MDQIKVSVIVLTYNHEKYIRQALDSILMQKVDFKYEILIGDDASTDYTVNILNEYKNKYPDIIKLYLNKVNVGATRNAYNLLMGAQGEYLATCEGDDYWIDENKLKIQIDFLDNNKEFVGCCHKFLCVDEESKKIKKWLRWINNKRIYSIKDFDGLIMPSQPSTFVRRNIFKNKEHIYKYIYTTNRLIADRLLLLIFLKYGNFYCINKIMGVYRIRKNESITCKKYLYNKTYLQEEYSYICELEKIGQLLYGNFNLKKRKVCLQIDAKLLKFFHKNDCIIGLCIMDVMKYGLDYIVYRGKIVLYEKIFNMYNNWRNL